MEKQRMSTIHQLFEAQAVKTPEAIAVSDITKLTYRELNEKAGKLADFLRERETGAFVGVMMDRSIEMVISLLGILKAGLAYIPIDRDYPEERIRHILKDSSVSLVLTREYEESLSETEQVIYDPSVFENRSSWSKAKNPEDLCYMIYTSGSTGKPKGTLLHHRGVVNYIEWAASVYCQGENNHFPLYTSISFDLTVTSLFTPLLTGNTLFIYREKDEYELIQKIFTEGRAGIVKMTPSHMKLLRGMDLKECSVHTLILGGEQLTTALSAEITEAFAGKVSLYNEYGPTEATVGCMIYKYSLNDTNYAVPIGKAIDNMTITLLDSNLKPVEKGEEGEIFIGGIQVARGYFNREELTKERFLMLPEISETPLYRTGDLAKYIDDENLEFSGRIDDQIKLRGYRIELGEIEKVLLSLPSVKDVCITVVNETSLAAYFTGGSLPLHQIKGYLEGKLPQYMVPSCFIPVDSIPLTPNGKADKTQLPDPLSHMLRSTDYEAPVSEMEKQLCTLWQRVLGQNQIGLKDNFHDLGGNSLQAVELIKGISHEMGFSLSLKEFFNCTCLKELSEYLSSEASKVKAEDLSRAPDPENAFEPFPLTEVQQAYLTGRNSYFELGNISTHAYMEFNTSLDIKRLNDALNSVIEHHPILRTVFAEGEQKVLQGPLYYTIEEKDLRELSPEKQKEELLKKRDLVSHKIFDTASWPLFEFSSMKMGDEQSVLIFRYDVLISDWFSLNRIGHELMKFYDDPSFTPEPFEFTFRDYMVGYDEVKKGEAYQKAREYWQEKVEDFPDSPGIPLIKEPSSVEQPYFKRIETRISQKEWSDFKERAAEMALTPSTLLLTAFSSVLSYWSNQERMAVNITAYNRYPFHRDVQELIGDFTKLLLLDVDFRGLNGVKARAEALKDTIFEGLDHMAYDGVEFTRDLALYRNSGNRAIMPVVFTCVLDNDNRGWQRVGEKSYHITQTSQVTLDNQICEIDGELAVNWDYVEELFDLETLNAMFRDFISSVRALAKGAKELNFTLPEEDQILLKKYNDTEEVFNLKPLHTLFAEQVLKTPEAAAVEDEKGSLTYRELDEASWQTASWLMSMGVKRGDFVSVNAARQCETIVNILGILKAGGAYVPLNSDYPEERISYIRENSGCSLHLDEESFQIHSMDQLSKEPFSVGSEPGDSAYVIYTSGSTGRPKGVHISHENACNTILDINNKFQVGEKDRIAGISSMCFDLSVYDIFGSLSTGASLVMVEDPRDFDGLIRTVKEKDITFWNSVPAIMDRTVERLDSLETVVTESETQEEKTLWYWSPAVQWKIIGEVFSAGRTKIRGEGASLFPELYFLAQEGLDLEIMKENFPYKEEALLNEVFDSLVQGKALVNRILSPGELFATQSPLLTHSYGEEILYNPEKYEAFKKDQLERNSGYEKDKICLGESPLPEMVERRRSYRSFDTEMVLNSEIFVKLLSSFRQIKEKGKVWYYYASAGGLYPIDIYVHIKEGRIQGIEGGLYCYNPGDNTLQKLADAHCVTDRAHYHGNRSIFNTSSCTVFMMYNPRVSMPKYEGMGYYYALIDAGIMVSTMTQVAEVHNMAVCSIGSMKFESIEEHFQLCEDQVFIHAVEVGIKDDLTEEQKTLLMPGAREAFEIRPYEVPVSHGDLKDSSLRKVLLSGDWIPLGLKDRIQKHFPESSVYSLGGATEASIWSIWHPINKIAPHWKSIPYGQPLANQSFYVLDTKGDPCPWGVPGELYIGGTGVALEYINDKEKTENSFIEHWEYGRIYRTGDYGVFRKSDEGEPYIEFLGRKDFQVKIGGYRIELGEIETALLRHKDLVSCVVVDLADENGVKYLAAYYVLPEEKKQNPSVKSELKGLVKECLPDYMMPHFFVEIDEIPLTANGKVARGKLPAPEMAAAASSHTREEAETALQKKLVSLWEQVLNRENIGISDDFNELGGNSLKAVQLAALTARELKVTLSLMDIFRNSTIKELTPVVEALSPVLSEGPEAQKVADWENLEVPFELTEVQMAYLAGRDDFFELGNTSTHYYTEYLTDQNLFEVEKALNKLIQNHPMLRAEFTREGKQRILPESTTYSMVIEDLRGLGEEKQEKRISQERERMSQHVFDAETWPLFEFKGYMLDEEKSVLSIGLDLLIADGFSINIIGRELYELCQNPSLTGNRPDFSFRDYVLAYGEVKESEAYKKARNYWQNKLEDFCEAPALPLKNSLSSVEKPHFNRLKKVLNREQWMGVQDFAKRNNTTAAVVLLTAYSEALSFWSNQERVAINTTVFNRIPCHDDVNSIVGDFTSLVLLDLEMKRGSSLKEKMDRVNETLLKALDHKHYDGVEFNKDLSRFRDTGTRAIMPVVFTCILDEEPGGFYQFGKERYSISQTSQVYLDTQILIVDGELAITWDYVTQLFEEETINALFDDFIGLIDACVSGASRELKLPQRDKQLIENYNATAENIPEETLWNLFVKQAETHPDAPALIDGDEVMSYRELHERSDRTAALLQDKGILPGDFAAVVVTREIPTIINLLGILKAGAAYVPLLRDYPEERRKYIMSNSNCKLLLEDDFPEKAASFTGDFTPVKPEPDNTAYVIYTSGSTGAPKGVVIAHKSACNTIQDINNRLSMGPGERILGISSMCFDLSVYDIFGALSSGAALVLLKDQRDIQGLADTLVEKEISLWNSVPAIMELVTEKIEKPLTSLKYVLLSGDWIPVTLPEKIRESFPSSQTWSLGGATEASIWSIYYPINRVEKEWSSIPYGYPLSNQNFYVLNEEGSECPVGVSGELYIGGIGVAQGYMADKEKTEKSFIEHNTHGRIYRTGDYGVFRKRGEDFYIEFQGRKDFQVKIGGYRIELGEIEAALSQKEGIQTCVITDLIDERGKKYLAAYYTASNDLPVSDLKKHLLTTLPDYMVPGHFIRIPSIPLTANGKVNKKALPSVRQEKRVKEVVSASSTIEKELIEVLKELLGCSEIGVNSDFFDLGGDSIKSIELSAKLMDRFGVTLGIRDIFKNSLIEDMAQAIEEAGGTASGGTEVFVSDKSALHKPFALTEVQRAYLQGRNDYFELGNTSTHCYSEYRTGHDLERLSDSVNRLITLHPMLRAVFTPQGEQKILEERTYDMEIRDLRGLTPHEQEEEILKARDEMSHRIFNPEIWPLFEFKAARLSDSESILFFGMDLIIADGYSLNTLGRDLAALYREPEITPEPMEFTFRDYILAYNGVKKSPEYRKAEAYWTQKVEDFPEAPLLPLQCEVSEVETPRFKRLQKIFTKNQWDLLKERARELDTTLSVLLLTVYAKALSYWSNQERVAINVTVFNRYPFHKDVNSIVGDFTSLVLLDISFIPGEKLTDTFKRVKEELLEALDNRAYDGVEFTRDLSRHRGTGMKAIMPIVFTSNLDETPGGWHEIGEEVYGLSQTSQVYLDTQIRDIAGDLSITWDYTEQLFDDEVIGNIFEDFTGGLTQLCEGRKEVDFFLSPVNKALLNVYNASEKEIPVETLHGLFEKQAALLPEAEALSFEGVSLSYCELDARANQWARYLQEKGVRPGDFVAVVASREIETIITLMGILKAGAAYVPLLPEYPQERRNYIFNNSGCKIFIDENTRPDLSSYETSKLKVKPDPSAPAYVIYTSGSTGEPKGVVIAHKSACNTIQDMNERLAITEKDRFLGISSMCFDLSVYDIFGSLASGASLVLLKDQRDIPALRETLIKEGITLWNSVPAIMELVADSTEEPTETLRHVLLSGDWIPVNLPEKIQKAFPSGSLMSLGGATEASIWSIYYPVDSVKEEWVSIPYGYPLSNQKFYVLGSESELCPPGVPGELYIGGVGVAEGYMGDREKTQRSFIQHKELGRIYRTGDYGVFRKDTGGLYIEFLGRKDFQVKIGGYRIELGEIESALLLFEGIDSCVVTDRKDKAGKKYLAAYYVGEEQEKALLRAHLLKTLPDYMIPKHFMFMESLPLTGNGKVNRKALPEPQGQVQEGSGSSQCEDNGVLALCRNILGVSNLSEEDDFFDMGGDSISIVELMNQLKTIFEVEISIRELFTESRIGDIVNRVPEELRNRVPGKTEAETIPHCEEKEFYPLTPSQKRMYTMALKDPESYIYQYIHKVEGPLDLDRLEEVHSTLVRRHESLRTQYHIQGDEVVQKILPHAGFTMERITCSESELDEKFSHCLRPFDLSKAPLYRVSAVTTGDITYLVSAVHHITGDGISAGIVNEEIAALYRGETLAPVTTRYRDYAVWSREKELSETSRSFWKKELSDAPLLDLPLGDPEGGEKGFMAASCSVLLEKEVSEKITSLARKEDATPFMTFLAAYNAWLSRLTHEREFIVGTPVAGRNHSGLENVVGIFINTLALKNQVKEGSSFSELLKEVRERTLESYSHQDFPYDEVVKTLNRRKSLFDTMVVFQNIQLGTMELEGCRVSQLEGFEGEITPVSLTLEIHEEKGQYRLFFKYNGFIYSEEEMEKALEGFTDLLKELSPEIAVDQLPGTLLASESEAEEVVIDFDF